MFCAGSWQTCNVLAVEALVAQWFLIHRLMPLPLRQGGLGKASWTMVQMCWHLLNPPQHLLDCLWLSQLHCAPFTYLQSRPHDQAVAVAVEIVMDMLLEPMARWAHARCFACFQAV